MGRKTPFFKLLSSMGHMGDFAGFEMPIWFQGILPETTAVREGAGLFDISHMGRVMIEGRDALAFLDRLATNDIASLQLMQSRYSLLCNEDGGILDDIIICRTGENRYMVCWNAANREKDLSWALGHVGDFDIEIEDISENSFMLALQGPRSQFMLQPLCDAPLNDVKRFRGVYGRVGDVECLITRTGYTGEDGFEIVSSDITRAEDLWRSLNAAGAMPAGLGARDVLRLEAGLPLYGQDMNETTNPFEARLEFAVKLEKAAFIGKGRLLEVSKAGVRKWLTGLRMIDRGIPRTGYMVSHDGDGAGQITSGTYSPTTKSGIAMAYLSKQLPCGTEVSVRIREADSRGVVTEMPFYDSKLYGFKREKV